MTEFQNNVRKIAYGTLKTVNGSIRIENEADRSSYEQRSFFTDFRFDIIDEPLCFAEKRFWLVFLSSGHSFIRTDFFN